MRSRSAFAYFFVVLALQAKPHRQVAITIDDLPLGGDRSGACVLSYVEPLTAQLLTPFRAEHIPVIGFVNAGKCSSLSGADLRRILDLWLDAGAELGNHTATHRDLNNTGLSDYEADISRGEPAIRSALASRGMRLRYFRHPFLHAGPDIDTKRALERYLAAHGYQVAPVTLDNSDYMFAAVYAAAIQRGDLAMAERVKQAYVPYLDSIFAFFEQRSVEVVGREIPQILLLHVSKLNAEVMPDLIARIRSRGYSFISLERALQDSAYQLADTYAGRGGFSWIHRWSKAKGMRPKGEPDEPPFIAEQWKALRH